ncbi:MAG: SDR family NAD(P)-dependent oxidoreductase [Chloroflexota bacterium]
MPQPKGWTLEGKTALITADRRGWATVLAGAMAEAGASVAVAGESREVVEAATQAVKTRGRPALAVIDSISDPNTPSAAVERVVNENGTLDVLVNLAQAQLGKPMLSTTQGEWEAVLDRNAGSAFRWCQAAGRVMLDAGQGSIVNMVSVMAERGLANHAAYSASQAAVQQMTRSVALEWAREGVRLNCIATGWFELDLPPIEEQRQELLVRYLPLRRKGTPQDIAALLIYLASDQSGFTTGQTISVDGGAMAHA